MEAIKGVLDVLPIWYTKTQSLCHMNLYLLVLGFDDNKTCNFNEIELQKFTRAIRSITQASLVLEHG